MHLSSLGWPVTSLESDFSDGVRLILLTGCLEVTLISVIVVVIVVMVVVIVVVIGGNCGGNCRLPRCPHAGAD